MAPVGQTPPSERHYTCGRCGGKSKNGHLGGDKTKRWRCHKCDHDVCFQCHPDKPLVHKDTLASGPDLLTRSTTVEVKRTLDRQLQELGGIPVLTAETAASSAGVCTGLQRSMPEASSEDDFLRRCQAALSERAAAGAAVAPTEVPASPRPSPMPSPASSTLLQRRGPTPTLGKTSEPGASIGGVLYDVLAPEQEFARVQAQLKRRPTLEVKRILEGQLEAFKDDPHLQPIQVEPSADERVTDVPELSSAPRGDGSVRCTCMA
jgi:hypothetical protein